MFFFFLVLFFSSSFRIRNLSRPRDTGFPRLWLVRSRRNLAAFARYTWRFSRGKERKKERKEGKKKKKNARRHPLETKFFRKRISLFGSELCPLSQVFTIRAWGSIEWWNWRGSRHHRRGTIRFFQNQRDQGFCAFEKVSTTLRLIASIKNESNVTIGRDRIVNINESAYSLVIKGGEGKREGGEAGGLNLDTSHLHLCYKCNVILMQRLRVECKRVRMRRAHRATMVR